MQTRHLISVLISGWLLLMCVASVIAQQRGSNAWASDCLHCPRPHYPLSARTRLAQGAGLFRLTLDPKTGAVAKVTTIQSSGSGSLDNSAIAAFKTWRLKPGKWKQIDVPVDFRIWL